MKKSNFTPWGAALTALLISFQSSHTYAAETCVAAPTCSELGYTLTSTSDCVGAVLKCPFDKTKYFCTKKTDVAYAVSPDYSQAVSRSANVTYTAATNGIIYGVENQRAEPGQGKDAFITLTIDGKNVREGVEAQVSWASNSWSYPIRKGSTYKLGIQSNGAETLYHFKFVPTY